MVNRLDLMTEPKSKAAIIWMLGEYSEKIKKSLQIFEKVAETFINEDVIVQK